VVAQYGMHASLGFWWFYLRHAFAGSVEPAAVELLGEASLDELQSHAPELRPGILAETLPAFEPMLKVRFQLLGDKDELFYSNVSSAEVLTLLRGRFSAKLRDGGEPAKVQLHMVAPSGIVVLERLASEDEFEVRADEEGVYSFHFSLGESTAESTVSLSLGRSATTDPHLSAEHAADMRLWVQAIETELSEIQTESALIWVRKKTHMDNVDGIWTRVFCFCLVQLVVVVGIQCFSGFYITGLFFDQSKAPPKPPPPPPRRTPSYGLSSSSRSRLLAGRHDLTRRSSRFGR